jgi:Protein of unknown function (DUF3306)
MSAKLLCSLVVFAASAAVDVKALENTSDYTRFLATNVPDEVPGKAMHKLWLSDPIFSNAEALDDYAGDFSDGARARPGEVIETTYKVGRGFVSDEVVAEGEKPGRPPVR